MSRGVVQHETARAARRLMRAAVGKMRYIGVGSYHAMQGVVRAHRHTGRGVAPTLRLRSTV